MRRKDTHEVHIMCRRTEIPVTCEITHKHMLYVLLCFFIILSNIYRAVYKVGGTLRRAERTDGQTSKSTIAADIELVPFA